MGHLQTRICDKCGWAHFAVSEEYTQRECDSFEKFITSQTDSVRGMYGYGPEGYQAKQGNPPKEWDREAYLNQYRSCFRCGAPYTDFHYETDADRVPMSVTMQPILTVDPNADM